ncbi:hypothetical protein ACEXQB_015645 [Herbiconiux sp. P18]|uniref:hypothetical protein n=1 Tax=Herbiconiux liangxiaofengii TaxID=3342795 RepID=UPI0035BAB797
MRAALSRMIASGAALAFLGALAGGGAAVAADGPSSDDTNLTVQVGAGTGAATTAPPAAGSATTTKTTTTTSINGDVVVTGPVSTPPVGDDEQSLGGILYISGLGTGYSPSIDPLSGDLHVHFTVRNVSSAAVDSSARFWVSNAFGGEIGSGETVDVAGLKPDESRVVDATISGVGQWTFATAHMTLTPPETVDGVTLTPLTRDAFVVLPPWFLLALGALAGLAYAVVRLVRSGSAARETVPAEALSGSTA